MSSLISMGYNKTTNKVEMTIVGDVEVTFGDDLCGALGLEDGAPVSEKNMKIRKDTAEFNDL